MTTKEIRALLSAAGNHPDPRYWEAGAALAACAVMKRAPQWLDLEDEGAKIVASLPCHCVAISLDYGDLPCDQCRFKAALAALEAQR